MLKKLVKYGNSNALVLDKALLELLNITEGSVVKIKTDGISLIITPQNRGSEPGTIMPTITPQEALNNAVQHNMAQYYSNPEEFMSEMRKLYARYDETIKKLNSPEYQEVILEFNRSYKGDRSSAEYGKALAKLGYKYAPEIRRMDEEIEILNKKYATKELEEFRQSKSAFTASVEKFKHIHEKYRYVQELLMKLNENSEYINESVLLAEKYQMTKNSPEYLKEHASLIAKYVPDYAQYQEELKAVAETVK